MSSPLFTLIVCTYQRADMLAYCLDSLVEQERPPDNWELLVIDNNSTDETRRVTEEFLDRHPNLSGRYLLEPAQGLSHARNRGYREATADWVIYLDDDAKADKRFLKRTGELIALDKFSVIGGVYLPWYHFGRPRWYKDHYASNALSAYTELSVPPSNYVATGGVMLWKKELLRELGGFDPRVGMVGKRIAYGEETYLQLKARKRGVKIAHDPTLLIYHVVMPQKLSVDWFFRSYFAAGRDAVLGGKVQPGLYSIIKQLVLAALVMTKDLIIYTPRLMGSDYYVENWLIDVFRKVAKRLGTVYTALLHGSTAHN